MPQNRPEISICWSDWTSYLFWKFLRYLPEWRATIMCICYLIILVWKFKKGLTVFLLIFCLGLMKGYFWSCQLVNLFSNTKEKCAQGSSKLDCCLCEYESSWNMQFMHWVHVKRNQSQRTNWSAELGSIKSINGNEGSEEILIKNFFNRIA